MLVLARREGERILLGDDIVVTVLEVGRDQVRIGISAPRSVSVHREEVYREILLENQAAAADAPAATVGVPGGAPGVAPVTASFAKRPPRPPSP